MFLSFFLLGFSYSCWILLQSTQKKIAPFFNFSIFRFMMKLFKLCVMLTSFRVWKKNAKSGITRFFFLAPKKFMFCLQWTHCSWGARIGCAAWRGRRRWYGIKKQNWIVFHLLFIHFCSHAKYDVLHFVQATRVPNSAFVMGMLALHALFHQWYVFKSPSTTKYSLQAKHIFRPSLSRTESFMGFGSERHEPFRWYLFRESVKPFSVT